MTKQLKILLGKKSGNSAWIAMKDVKESFPVEITAY